jgi:hypothetical protein
MKELRIMAGIPIKSSPKNPIDQDKCKLSTCRFCNNKMWLTQKKAKLIIKFPTFFVLCWECLWHKFKNKEFSDYIIKEIAL